MPGRPTRHMNAMLSWPWAGSSSKLPGLRSSVIERLDAIELQHRENERDSEGNEESFETILSGSLASRHEVRGGLLDGVRAEFRTRGKGEGGITAGPSKAVIVGQTSTGARIPRDVEEDPLA